MTVEEQNIPSACAAAIDWLKMEALIFRARDSLENAKMAEHTARLIEQLKTRIAPPMIGGREMFEGEKGREPPEPDTIEFTKEELNLIRQWFNATEDCAGDYLEKADYDLMEKIMAEFPDIHFKRKK